MSFSERDYSKLLVDHFEHILNDPNISIIPTLLKSLHNLTPYDPKAIDSSMEMEESKYAHLDPIQQEAAFLTDVDNLRVTISKLKEITERALIASSDSCFCVDELRQTLSEYNIVSDK